MRVVSIAEMVKKLMIVDVIQKYHVAPTGKGSGRFDLSSNASRATMMLVCGIKDKNTDTSDVLQMKRDSVGDAVISCFLVASVHP